MTYFEKIINYIREIFGVEKPQIPDILMLIALNEKGIFAKKLSKKQKTELINYGMLVLLEQNGYAKKVGEEIIPTNPLPPMNPAEQTLFIKQMIIKYFKDNEIV